MSRDYDNIYSPEADEIVNDAPPKRRCQVDGCCQPAVATCGGTLMCANHTREFSAQPVDYSPVRATILGKQRLARKPFGGVNGYFL